MRAAQRRAGSAAGHLNYCVQPTTLHHNMSLCNCACFVVNAGSAGGSPNTPSSNQLPVGLGSGSRSGVVRARAAAGLDKVQLARSAAAAAAATPATAAGVPSVSKEVSSKPGFVDVACQYSTSRLLVAARRQEQGEEEQQATEDTTAAAAAAAAGGTQALVDAGVGDDYVYEDDGGDDYAGAGGDYDLDGLEQQQQEEGEEGDREVNELAAAAAAAGEAAAAAAAAAGGGGADVSPEPRMPAMSAGGLTQQQEEEEGEYDDMQGVEAGECRSSMQPCLLVVGCFACAALVQVQCTALTVVW